MTDNLYLDSYENNLLNSVENEEWEEMEDIENEKLRLKQYATFTQQKKNVSALIHNYANGKIAISL